MSIPTREIRGRTISRNYEGITGTRIFVGPQKSIISDLEVTFSCAIGNSWPTTDTVVSDNWNISSLHVNNINLEYNFGQKEAQATVKYSTRDWEKTPDADEGNTQVSMDCSSIEIDEGQKEGTKTAIVQSDLNDVAIEVEDVITYRPTAVYRISKWFTNTSRPEASDLFYITGKVNDGAWAGASAAEYWLCSSARMRQIETDKWQVDYEFTYSPVGNDDRTWNEIYKHKDFEDDGYIKLYPSVNFDGAM